MAARTKPISGSVLDTAPAIFDRIRDNLTKTFEHRQKALEDIVLVHERGWWNMDYATFEACLEAELNIERFSLQRQERQAAVAFLDGAGLSTRAIAAALGTSQTTVTRDTQLNQNGSVGPKRRKTGLDGKSRPARSQRPKPTPPSCLTPKAANVLATARDLGEFATRVGKELVALELVDIVDLSFEELEALHRHLYRVRHTLKNCLAKLQ